MAQKKKPKKPSLRVFGCQMLDLLVKASNVYVIFSTFGIFLFLFYSLRLPQFYLLTHFFDYVVAAAFPLVTTSSWSVAILHSLFSQAINSRV